MDAETQELIHEAALDVCLAVWRPALANNEPDAEASAAQAYRTAVTDQCDQRGLDERDYFAANPNVDMIFDVKYLAATREMASGHEASGAAPTAITPVIAGDPWGGIVVRADIVATEPPL
jgi:hypothetical protein